MVEGAEYHHHWQQEEDARDDHFLYGSGFRRWPSIHTPLEGRRVLQTQVDGRNTRCDGKDRDKNPCLPVIERPRWQKQQQSKHDKSKKSCYCCLKTCFHNLFSLFSSRVPSAHWLADWTWRTCYDPSLGPCPGSSC